MDKPHPGCAAQGCGQEIPIQILFGSISKMASLCRKKMCHWATILDPVIHPEKALCVQVWGSLGKQPAWWPGLRAFLSALAGSRKLFIATPFPVRLGTRLRAWFFTGPIWRQVFQIKSSASLILKMAASSGGSPSPMLISGCETSTLINDYLFGRPALLCVFGFLLQPPARVPRCLS